jgi:hypothetical protein
MANGTPDESRRISVSEDKLDAKLAGLELRLVDRLTRAIEVKADAAVVEAIQGRLRLVEGTLQGLTYIGEEQRNQRTEIDALQRFRYAVPSVALLSLIVAIATTIYALLH